MARTQVADVYLWRGGPAARAAIVSVTEPVDTESLRTRPRPLYELAHVTVEVQQE